MGRRLAVILAADVVDYTAMMEEDADAAIALIRELRESLLEPVIRAHDGEVLKRMGDGWIAAFASPGAAVDCAVAAQTGLSGHPRLRLRMGVHLGEIVEDEADFYGAGVNLAARLQTEAPPGGVLISGDVRRQLSEKQAADFADAGAFRLKNIAEPVNGFQWRPDGVAPGRRADGVPVITVEPFAAAPDDGDTRAAAADLREQILLGLSRRTGLRVRDPGTGAPTYILRGRMRNAGGRGRLNLSLVLAEDGGHLWSGAFDGDAADLFAFCDATAARAGTELRLHFNRLDGDRIAGLPDEALSGSELRSRAASEFYKATVASFERAQALTERALRLNPEDHMAAAMRVCAVVFLAAARHEDPTPEFAAEVAAQIDGVIEATPRSDFAFWMRAATRAHFLGDAEGALQDVRRCRQLNPGYEQVRVTEGAALMLLGRFGEAAATLRKLVEVLSDDPLGPGRAFYLAVALYCDGDREGAAEVLADLAEVLPAIRAHATLHALALRDLGREEEAGRREKIAAAAPDAPHIFAQRPPLPEQWRWLADALAPGSA